MEPKDGARRPKFQPFVGWRQHMRALMLMALNLLLVMDCAEGFLFQPPFNTGSTQAVHSQKQKDTLTSRSMLKEYASLSESIQLDQPQRQNKHHSYLPRRIQLSYRPSPLRTQGRALGAATAENGENSDDTNNPQSGGPFQGWFRSSSNSNDSSSDSSQAARKKVNLDGLMKGMPSLGEILSGGNDADDTKADTDAPDSIDSRRPRRSSRLTKKEEDDSWFEEERKQIVANYEEILQTMLKDLDDQRTKDPGAVPESAAPMLQSVLRQEMDTEIQETLERRRQERFQEYETQQQEMDKQAENEGDVDLSNVNDDASLKQLIDETELEYRQQAKSQALLDEFLQYEAEAFQRAAAQEIQDLGDDDQSPEIPRPRPNQDMDNWAMERLQDMATTAMEDNDEVVRDIVEENLQDLKNRLEEKEADATSRRQTQQPETMKEWQMYRSIATKMGASVDSKGRISKSSTSDDASSSTSPDVKEEDVHRRLESWKEYNKKEDGIRRKGGLARGPKLPFEWQESSALDEVSDKRDSKASDNKLISEKQKRNELRKEINRQSIQALESLLQTSDTARRAKLQEEIDFLKRELEGKDYLDWEEPEDDIENADNLAGESKGPVDLSDVFARSRSERELTIERSPQSFAPSQSPPESQLTSPLTADVDNITAATPQPPATAFFDTVSSPPPNTPFFNADGEDTKEDDVAATDSKLGTMEEQKLEAMYRRAGARTRREQDQIRSQWEEFQRLEQERRQQSGLDKEQLDFGNNQSVDSLKYNVSDVMQDGGDFDASKVLAAIGPRPTRTRQSNQTKVTSKEGEKAGEMSGVSDQEVFSSIYRSVAAAGGGRFKDNPEGQKEDKAAFSEYLDREKEMREALDKSEQEVEENTSISKEELPTGLDDLDYAKRALASLRPRPQVNRQKRQIDEKALSDGQAISEADDEGEDDEVSDTTEKDEVLDTPLLLTRERRQQGRSQRRRFLSRNEEDEEDGVSREQQYEKNMLQLAEFERRRAGNEKPMGIDLSDVFGPRKLDTDDYRDFKYADDLYRQRRVGWGGATYETKKRDLLEYRELDVAQLNGLFEERDAVSATGASRYMPKIIKPFRDFGVICRLEGVVADLTGLNLIAWSRVAENNGLRVPSEEEAKMASVMRPELAVRDTFAWSSEVSEIQKLVVEYRQAFDNNFREWTKSQGITLSASSVRTESTSERGSLAIGAELVSESSTDTSPTFQKSEEEVFRAVSAAWAAVAQEFTFGLPTEEQLVASLGFPPDLSAAEIFKWTSDRKLLKEISAFYQRTIEPSSPKTSAAVEEAPISTTSKKNTSILDENALMELHYKAWNLVAWEYAKDTPTSDQVLASFVLNDPAIAVVNSFGWTKDKETAAELGGKFGKNLKQLLSEHNSFSPPEVAPTPVKNDEKARTQNSESSGFQEVIKMHFEAWEKVAKNHGFALPTIDQVGLSVRLEPAEVVQRLFRWSSDKGTIMRIVETFLSTLREVSTSYSTVANQVSLISAAGHQASQRTQLQDEEGAGPSEDEVHKAVWHAWSSIASQRGLPEPTTDQVLYAISVGPEEAIRYGFRWASEPTEVKHLLDMYKHIISLERSKMSYSTSTSTRRRAQPPESPVSKPLVSLDAGVADWVKSLQSVEMAVGVISHLTQPQVACLLQFAGLDELINSDQRVSIEHCLTTTAGFFSSVQNQQWDSQQMLAAALRIERRPDHCVVVDASPVASLAAHDVEMQSVACVGFFPRYELLAADSAVRYVDELTAMNVRRLFGERISDQPMLDAQQTEPVSPKVVKTRYDWEDE